MRRFHNLIASLSRGQMRIVCLLAGMVTALALPPWGWWPLAFVGLAVIYLVLDQVERILARFEIFWIAMLGFFIPGLAWMVDLTPPGYVISVPIMAAMMAAPMAFTRRGSSLIWSFPAALVLGEAWHFVFPFGGVPMSSLAMGQVGGPLLPVVRAFGGLGLVAAVGVAAAVVACVISGRERSAAAGLAVLVVSVVIGQLAPDGTVIGSEPVAVVQAGGELGTRAVNSNAGTVFERHVEATRDVAPGTLTIWSESAVTTNAPFELSEQFQILSDFARSRDITVIAGLTERLDDDFFSNGTVTVTPTGELLDRYNKVHLVPFGEYIPLRSFVENFADLSLIPRTAIPGTEDARLETPNGPIAVAISFEVYFGERVRDGVNAGGEIIVNPTLASSYRTTHVPEQTLAAARIRAVEYGRWVLQSSTTGYSAIVKPDGTVVARTGLKEARVLTAVAERRTGATWPLRTGKVPITALALIVLVGSALASQFLPRSANRLRS